MRALMDMKRKLLKIKKSGGLIAPILALTIIMGVMPTQNAVAAETRELVPMGVAVGIELKTPGAIVVGLETVEGDTASSPAATAGVLRGDLIVRLGASEISSAADFLGAANEMDGSPISLTVVRGDKKMQFTLNPAQGEDGYKLGVWIRDSITGIGTVTFCDPETGIYGALGHPINDADSGIIMPLGSGSIMDTAIVSVNPGQSGKPGELRGMFDVNKPSGCIMSNSFAGIFGKMTEIDKTLLRDPLPIADENDIEIGEATILSCISGHEIQEYKIEIIKTFSEDGFGRDLMLKITDPALLDKTGGIVQGMSGSPIIQNGKLVGAVTHVLVNDPSKGYGIFISTMLSEAENVLNEKCAA